MENIQGRKDIIDPFYRYRMPIMKIKQNKNQTTIENLDLIGKSLDRSSLELLKMFSYCLGTSSNMKKKSLSGIYNYQQLHDHLIKYIDQYILCEHCENPETIYVISKKKLYIQCKACSGLTLINGDDRLIKYIISNLCSQ